MNLWSKSNDERAASSVGRVPVRRFRHCGPRGSDGVRDRCGGERAYTRKGRLCPGRLRAVDPDDGAEEPESVLAVSFGPVDPLRHLQMAVSLAGRSANP